MRLKSTVDNCHPRSSDLRAPHVVLTLEITGGFDKRVMANLERWKDESAELNLRLTKRKQQSLFNLLRRMAGLPGDNCWGPKN